MNPAFRRLLAKKPRARDPDAPPPPTLLSQVKELRLTKEEINRLLLVIEQQNYKIEKLEQNHRRVESQLRDFENFVRSRLK